MKILICLFSLLISIGFLFAEEKKEVAPIEKKETPILPPALERAVKENKSVLLLFTGLDDCGACKVLEKNILGSEKFTAFAKKSIVFVSLDYPQFEMPSPEKNKLYQEYGIEGFPTLLLTDEKGIPFQRINNDVESTEVFIESIEFAIKKRNLKSKFLASKDDEEKKKLSKEFLASRTEGESFVFFADLISFGVLQDKELKAEEKIKQLSDLYLFSNDTAFYEKLKPELIKLDPEKKLGTSRLFLIKDFSNLLMAHNDEKAYEYYTANKTKFKGNDLQYIYEYAMLLKEQGNLEKTTEILAFILTDDEIKKNEEAVKNLTEQIKDIKAEMSKPKTENPKDGTSVSVKVAEEPVKKADEVKAVEKAEEKLGIKVEVEKVKKE